MEIIVPLNYAFARWLVAIVILIANIPGAYSDQPGNEIWPVAVAKNGFSLSQCDTVLANFASINLALGENQALYTYLNMAQFFPHQQVSRTGEVKPLVKKLRPKLGKVRVVTQLGNLSFQEMIAHPKSRVQGIIVLHQGNIVFESYPGMRASDSHLWWSLAKVITGLVVEQLIHEKKLDPTQKIAHYLPEFSESAWAEISVQNILDMASGIDAVDTAKDYVDPTSGIGRLISAEGILAFTTAQTIAHNQALKLMDSHAEPGLRYEYSSANTNILALLIEALSNRRYADVVQERVWSKIGAEADALLGLSPDGRAIAHGMFASRLRDLGRFGLLYTPAGRDEATVAGAVLNKITDIKSNQHYQNAPAAAENALNKLGERPVNALSQWDALFSDGDLFKSGFDGQALYVSPSRDVVIAMFSTSKNKSAYAYLRAIAKQFPLNSARPKSHY
ncbi:serine hydrolase domain-containing protein [Zhongshania sp.]|uniref:serine hydrolase domain-containing protein n=1 Tax=Zhongshania sp. TaxID=1971902 RepID=UPI003565A37B